MGALSYIEWVLCACTEKPQGNGEGKIDMRKQNQIDVIGVPVSVVTKESALDFVHDNLELIRGEYICAANVHTTVMAHEQSEYLRVQKNAVLVLPDGKPLSVVGKIKTAQSMEKVTGFFFMHSVFVDPRFDGKRHFFYGTDKKTLELMIEKLHQDYPELNICGYEPSLFRELSDDEIDELVLRMNQSAADFIWIALGAPRQEVFMNRLRGRSCGVMCGVGGAFKILAGIISNAPVWMQEMGLEWLYRLIKEPKRLFRRYLVTNTKFIYYLLTGK